MKEPDDPRKWGERGEDQGSYCITSILKFAYAIPHVSRT